jgi:predicted amidohydrolase YtcJ
MTFILKLSILLSALLASGCNGDAADIIFHGGPVLTVNATDDVVQALAVRDGLIIAVGSETEVMVRKGPRTELVDLQGRALLPGFVGAHEHPSVTAVFSGALDLSGFTHRSNAEVWQAFRQAVAATPKGEWIYAGGLDPILVPDLKIPDRKALDAMAPDNPVVLAAQSLHSFWANSQAFEEAGISRDTPDPGAGAYYERDVQGELTGFVAEARAAGPLLEGLKSPWPIYGRYVQTLEDLLANGFTSVASLGLNVPPVVAQVAASRQFTPRIRQFFYMTEEELNHLPDQPDTSDDYFRVLGVKLWHDGSPYTGSMYSSVPYLDSLLGKTLGIVPGSHGAAIIADDALTEKIRHYSERGWQVAIHSQGDISNRAVVQAVERAGPLNGPLPVVRLEHSVFMPSDSVKLLAKLAGTVSFHIHHVKYYGDALANSIVGYQAAMQVLPVKQAFAEGLKPSLHADSPMYPADGFALMQTAINRRSNQGLVMNAMQGIDVQQALRAMTFNAAYQLRLAEQTGSLEPGKWADLQIVERNPYETPVDELDKIRIDAVYVGGRQEYAAR